MHSTFRIKMLCIAFFFEMSVKCYLTTQSKIKHLSTLVFPLLKFRNCSFAIYTTAAFTITYRRRTKTMLHTTDSDAAPIK